MNQTRAMLTPSREKWELLLNLWQLFPIITAAQWLIRWYPAGKTSITSKFNLPGKWAWLTMEIPGPFIVLYLMLVLPKQLNLSSLPWQNWTLAGMYTIHYIYRAILFPILNPSMSPMHIVVWLMAINFNIINGCAIGGWLAGYGPTTHLYWADRLGYVYFGMLLWAFGLIGNIFHDDDLREIRRSAKTAEMREMRESHKNHNGQNRPQKAKRQDISTMYMIPKNGLFQLVLHAHYFCEWIEWVGFWIVGGSYFIPGRIFVTNLIATMLPRALQGQRWYIANFGKDAVGQRKAVIPGLL